MATNFSDVSKCPNCAQAYDKPKILPCWHSVCYKCIESCVTKGSNNLAKCPVCQQNVPDTTELPDNKFLSRLVEMSKSEWTKKTKCEACSRTADDPMNIPAAEKFCLECNEKLCCHCADAHRKLKLTIGHKLIGIEADLQEAILLEYAKLPSTCAEHLEQHCTLFCTEESCQKPICMSCAFLSHKGHRFEELGKRASSYRNALQARFEDIFKRRQQFLKTEKDDFPSTTKLIEQTAASAEEDIRKQAKILHEFIDKTKNNLLAQLREVKKSRMSELGPKNFSQQLSSFKSNGLINFAKEFIQKANDYELCELHDKVAKAFQDYQTNMDFIKGFQPCDIRIRFNCFPKKDLDAKLLQLFGQISTERDVVTNVKDKTEFDCARFLRSNASQRKERGNQSITGLALIKTDLFAIYDNSNIVYQLNAQSLKVIKQYPITLINIPTDMVTVGDSNQLFIAGDFKHQKDKCLVSFDVNSHALTTLPTKYFVYSLSVTQHSTILATCKSNFCILEYCHKPWQLLRRIRTLFTPFHAIQLSDGRYVFCQRGGNNAQLVIRVSIDSNVASYEVVGLCAKNSHGHQLTNIFKGPSYVTVDRNGKLLVLECQNNSVVRIDQSFNSMSYLIRDESKILKPRRFCFDELNGVLYIGTMQGVQVFQVH